MSKKGYIYVIKENNVPVYVGQTIKEIKDRWNEHLALANRGKGFVLHEALRKHKSSIFEISEIEETEDLNQREKYWIKKLHTHISENGYNLTWGGEQSSDLVKVKCYQYDINGKFLKEYPSINEAARMMNGSHNGIIKVLQKELNTAYGFRWSYEKKESLGKLQNNYTGCSKAINQYDLNGNFVRQYSSTKEAARALGKSQGNISSAANGKRKTAYGYIWRFAD